MLAVWAAIVLAVLIGTPFLPSLINLLPGFRYVWFTRYIFPSLELSVVILACFGLQDWLEGVVPWRVLRRTIAAAAVAAALGMAAGWRHIVSLFAIAEDYPVYLLGSLASTILILASLALLLRSPQKKRGIFIAAALAGEAIGLAQFALLAGYRHATLDRGAVRFLQQNIGLSRFYSIGPLCANYGAYFGVASLNFDYLPLPAAWADYINRQLFPRASSELGCGPPRIPLPPRLPSLAAMGVRFILANPGTSPFTGMASPPPLVYRSQVTDIFELPRPAPYFQITAGSCRLSNITREQTQADCDGPALLERREMAAEGWRVAIGEQAVPVRLGDGIFQEVRLPPGRSLIRFAYAPPRTGWAYAAFVFGLCSLLLPLTAGFARWRRGSAPRHTLPGPVQSEM